MRAPHQPFPPMRLIAIAFCCAVLSGCVYRIDVQQGNYVTQDAVAKMKEGMNKAEVRQVLGTPLLVDVFHNDRWDYYFASVKGGKREDSKRFSVFFKDDKVVSFGGTSQPPAPPPVAAPARTTPPPPK